MPSHFSSQPIRKSSTNRSHTEYLATSNQKGAQRVLQVPIFSPKGLTRVFKTSVLFPCGHPSPLIPDLGRWEIHRQTNGNTDWISHYSKNAIDVGSEAIEVFNP